MVDYHIARTRPYAYAGDRKLLMIVMAHPRMGFQPKNPSWDYKGDCMATMSGTQEKQFMAHKTPTPSNPIWFENPPPHLEDPEDKKTPARVRDVQGDFYVLVEQVNYLTFPPPEVRAAMKAAGRKVVPLRVFQVYIHAMHSRTFTTRTLKVYKHQKRVLYSDSMDFEVPSARKSGPDKSRETMVGLLARMFKTSEDEASSLLSNWTLGN